MLTTLGNDCRYKQKNFSSDVTKQARNIIRITCPQGKGKNGT